MAVSRHSSRFFPLPRMRPACGSAQSRRHMPAPSPDSHSGTLMPCALRIGLSLLRLLHTFILGGRRAVTIACAHHVGPGLTAPDLSGDGARPLVARSMLSVHRLPSTRLPPARVPRVHGSLCVVRLVACAFAHGGCGGSPGNGRADFRRRSDDPLRGAGVGCPALVFWPPSHTIRCARIGGNMQYSRPRLTSNGRRALSPRWPGRLPPAEGTGSARAAGTNSTDEC